MELSKFMKPLEQAVKRRDKEAEDDEQKKNNKSEVLMEHFDYICNELRSQSLMLLPMKESDYVFLKGMVESIDGTIQFVG